MSHKYKPLDQAIVNSPGLKGHGKLVTIESLHRVKSRDQGRRNCYYVWFVNGIQINRWLELEINLVPYTEEYRLLYE